MKAQKTNFLKYVGAKSVFLKSVGAAAPTAPMLTRPLLKSLKGMGVRQQQRAKN